jgi:hypothetical protein
MTAISIDDLLSHSFVLTGSGRIHCLNEVNDALYQNICRRLGQAGKDVHSLGREVSLLLSPLHSAHAPACTRTSLSFILRNRFLFVKEAVFASL